MSFCGLEKSDESLFKLYLFFRNNIAIFVSNFLSYFALSYFKLDIHFTKNFQDDYRKWKLYSETLKNPKRRLTNRKYLSLSLYTTYSGTLTQQIQDGKLEILISQFVYNLAAYMWAAILDFRFPRASHNIEKNSAEFSTSKQLPISRLNYAVKLYILDWDVCKYFLTLLKDSQIH